MTGLRVLREFQKNYISARLLKEQNHCTSSTVNHSNFDRITEQQQRKHCKSSSLRDSSLEAALITGMIRFPLY